MAKRKRKKRYSGPNLTASSELEAGDTIEVVAGAWDERGNATATHRGAPVSIHGAIPGETVEAEVVKVFPERIATRAVNVIHADEDRGVPRCHYFGECSGCQWQHVRYERQLEIKHAIVSDALAQHQETAGATVKPLIASPKRFGYRNHARFSVGRGEESAISGFVNADTRRFVRIDHCAIMDDRINETLAKLQGRLTRMTQWSVRVGANSGDMTIQPLLPAEILDVESGRQHYFERINDIDFKVAASAFFQVNSHMIPTLVDVIVDMLAPSGDETLVDLYCGVGTISCLLAGAVGRVMGIEESASAIENAMRNSIPLSNVEFIQAKSEVAASEVERLQVRPDFVIVDPPRSGCDDRTLTAISDFQPWKVVMVSCEPTSLARDLAALSRAGFTLIEVQPLDMFPQTRHVETVALMARRREVNTD